MASLGAPIPEQQPPGCDPGADRVYHPSHWRCRLAWPSDLDDARVIKHEIATAGQDDDTPTEQIQLLRELIDALDRRVPQIERTGEIQIARDAADLREKALKRLAALRS
jgi:hypothetical protein